MSQSFQPKWVKPLRVFIWLVVIILAAIGIGLYFDAFKTAAYTTGTHDQKISVATCFVILAIILGVQNLTLGVTRWLVRRHDEKWSAGKTIGKLIGGGIWRALVIVPISLVAFFTLPTMIGHLVEQNVVNNKKPFPEELDIAERSLENAASNLEQMSEEEIQEVFETALLSNIDFDTDASGNISSKRSLLSQNAFAYTKNLKVLNKAYLSPNQHFIVFYTDTGDDAIFDADAQKLAGMLDLIIESYKSELALDFVYAKETANSGREKNAKKVLTANNIDENALDFAMPVYIANPYKNGSNTLASYAGTKFNELSTSIIIKLGALFGEETAKLYNTAATFPFVNILPSNISDESLALVTAHELGHHYESTHCKAAFGGDCDNSSTTERKIYNEGLTNWFATMTIKDQPEDNLLRSHHATYIEHATCEPANKIASVFEGCISTGEFLGYPANAFISNVYDALDSTTGKKVLLSALGSDDFLKYLDLAIENNVGSDVMKKRHQIMQNLSERNLTNDYGGRYALYADSLPASKELPCSDFCSEKYTIPYATIMYFAMAPSEYKDRKITFETNNSNVSASFVGKRNGKFEVISHTNYGEQNLEHTISDDYEIVMLAVANTSFQSYNEFQVKVEVVEIEELLDDTPLEEAELGTGCFDLGKAMGDLMDASLDFVRSLEEILHSEEYSQSLNEAEANMAEAKTELNKSNIILCEQLIKSGVDFDTAFNAFRKIHDFEIFNFALNEDTHIGISGGVNFTNRTGKIYLIVEDSGQLQAINITVTQR